MKKKIQLNNEVVEKVILPILAQDILKLIEKWKRELKDKYSLEEYLEEVCDGILYSEQKK